MICIQDMPDSNLGRGFPYFSPGKCRYNISYYTMTYHTASNSSYNNHPIIRSYSLEYLTADKLLVQINKAKHKVFPGHSMKV